MNEGQTTSAGGSSAKRLLLAAGLAALCAVAAVLFVSPFARAGKPWEWRPRSEQDLFGASVNANLVSVDADGVLLTPQGQRPISLITPPLKLSADANLVLAVRAARPDLPAGQTVETTVVLLWQTEPAKGYHYQQQTVGMTREPGLIEFGLPVPPQEVYRMGVQLPGVADHVRIASIALPRQTPAERLALAWREAAGPELIANHSVNFLQGPRILGRAFNYYLLLAIVTACTAYAAVQVVRRRGVSRRTLAAIVFIIWLVADGQATRNIARQALEEASILKGKSWAEQVELMDGREIAWAYQQLLENMPPGSTFAVVSDDDFTPSRRLAYLLAPQRIWHESPAQAEFIVVIRAGEAAFAEPGGMFRWRSDTPVKAERIAAMSPEVYLLRVRRAATVSPTTRSAAARPWPRGNEQSRDRKGAVPVRFQRPSQSWRNRSLTRLSKYLEQEMRSEGYERRTLHNLRFFVENAPFSEVFRQSLTVAALFEGAGAEPERDAGRRSQ